MRDLDLVGLSEDASHVLLRADSGEDFCFAVDDRLRAALRGDRARPSQLERPMDSAALRPRDIQARIRAGESPEAVAAVAQVSVERIMGYAVPVLAEREHVCEQARRSGLRRKHASGPGRLLGEAVDEHLRGDGWDPTAANWDSWRREDGRWSITVSASRSGEPATFLYDVPGRYVVAHDDAARRLVGDEPPLSVEPEGDEPRAGVPRVALVAAQEPEQEPEQEPAVERSPEPGPKPRVSALDRLRRQRTQAGEQLAFDAGAAEPEPVAAADGTDADMEAIARVMSDETAHRPVAVGESGDTTPARSRRKSRRSSVPSWDEIMFGSKPPS